MNKYALRRAILKIFYIFPVKKNKVMFSSFSGRSQSCNPKRIYLELKRRYGDKLEYIWDLNEDDGSGVKRAKHNSLKYIYHILTSKVIVFNFGVGATWPLRKKQICINTWHGSGAYKQVGLSTAAHRLEKDDERVLCYDARNTTYYISGCRKFTEVMEKSKLIEREKFLEIGTPRNDIIINGAEKDELDKIRARIGLAPDKKLVLYAPTYRGKYGDAQSPDTTIDPEMILDSLSRRFKGEWVFAYRCHYLIGKQFKGMSEKYIDLSSYDDMQELLLVADALITDYSSCIWDYSFLNRPCFLYCYDLAQYTDEWDFYVPIERWGFPVAETLDELREKILSFDQAEFENNMRRHHEELGSFENGTATEKICDLIAEKLKL